MGIAFLDGLWIASQILGGLLLADFLTGLIHWFEDRFGDPDWPLIGGAIKANHEHHHKPRAFLSSDFVRRNKEVFIVTLMVLGLFAAFGLINAFTVSAVGFGFFANEFHASAHRSAKENGALVAIIQSTGLMQSFTYHAHHHRGLKDCHYCVMTIYVNPVIDRLGIFRIAEQILKVLWGIVPRCDRSINPRFRNPASES